MTSPRLPLYINKRKCGSAVQKAIYPFLQFIAIANQTFLNYGTSWTCSCKITSAIDSFERTKGPRALRKKSCGRRRLLQLDPAMNMSC